MNYADKDQNPGKWVQGILWWLLWAGIEPGLFAVASLLHVKDTRSWVIRTRYHQLPSFEIPRPRESFPALSTEWVKYIYWGLASCFAILFFYYAIVLKVSWVALVWWKMRHRDGPSISWWDAAHMNLFEMWTCSEKRRPLVTSKTSPRTHTTCFTTGTYMERRRYIEMRRTQLLTGRWLME